MCGPVQTYKLNTVTYWTTCAPYRTTRTIQQLARDEGEYYPLAVSVTIRYIYMDDILTKLWILKLEWDEPLYNPIAKEWNDFVSTLPVIQNIYVPLLVIRKGRIIIQGFAYALTAAYGAALYAQSISEEDVSTRLLCSKSRVAPVKPITIPRLELCACVLLSQLLENVLHSLTIPIQQIMLWIDSNIVLNHNSRNPSVKRSGPLDYNEVNEAELCLIKNLQTSVFQEEIEYLAKGGCNSKKASKAVHLEIVSDLTTDAFLATLKRFVARRGKCAIISSDNAKNFVGANRGLKILHNLLKFPEEKRSSYLSSEGISWNFMPP
ncbi:integrase catalytic domain-containing protein [Trichonephila clavipes]|nr:integrase catalytic domain-containing protein [Trichonephila clavipes]